MMRQGATPPPATYPPDTPPGNWQPLMDASRWTVGGFFSDPCTADGWSVVSPWEPYPGNLAGIEKTGTIGSSSCRFGFSLYAQGSFFDTFRPSRLLIGVRRDPQGSIGATAHYSPGFGRAVNPSSILDSDDTVLVFDATVWDSNLNRIFFYVNQIPGGNNDSVRSFHITYIGYEN